MIVQKDVGVGSFQPGSGAKTFFLHRIFGLELETHARSTGMIL